MLAHELGHHVHKDIPLGILIQSGLTLVGFWLADHYALETTHNPRAFASALTRLAN